MKLLIHLPIQLLGHGPRIYHTFMNLLAHGPTSTNLPAGSPTYVIQQLWTSSLAAALKCEYGTYVPPHSYPHTKAS